MRTLINMVAALTAILGVGVLAYFGWSQARHELGVSVTQSAVERIQREIARRASMDGVVRTETGWPVSIDAAWFEDGVPRNALVAGNGRAWIEIASDEEKNLSDPRVRAITPGASGLAEFWYNPARGIVRARVASRLSDRAALDAYNRINHTHLDAIVEGASLASVDDDAAR